VVVGKDREMWRVGGVVEGGWGMLKVMEECDDSDLNRSREGAYLEDERSPSAG
jgi:hypothetical protein